MKKFIRYGALGLLGLLAACAQPERVQAGPPAYAPPPVAQYAPNVPPTPCLCAPAQEVVEQYVPPTPTIRRVVERRVEPAPSPRAEAIVHRGPSCPLVHDATFRERYDDGQMRFAWHGQEYWFMSPRPSQDSKLCNNRGVLAWWTPPRPTPLD